MYKIALKCKLRGIIIIIEKISYKLSEAICYPIDKKSDVDTIRYSIEIIIKSSIKIMSLLVIGLLLSNLSLLLCTSLAFIIFRLLAGGFHFQSYMYCYLFSIGMLSALSLIAEVLSNLFMNWTFLILSLSAISIIILLICKPLINISRPYSEKRTLYLVLSLIYLALCIPITVFLIEDYLEYSISIQLAVLAQSMTLINLKKGGD